jgi:hypothetical protein
MSRRKVYGWVERFKGGRTGVVVDARSGRTSTVKCAEVKEQIYQHIRDNRSTSIYETAFEMSISHGKKRCKNGLWPNGKHGIPMESGEYWTIEQMREGVERLSRKISFVQYCMFILSKFM